MESEIVDADADIEAAAEPKENGHGAIFKKANRPVTLKVLYPFLNDDRQCPFTFLRNHHRSHKFVCRYAC